MKRAWETREVPVVSHISVTDAVLIKNSCKVCLSPLSCPLLRDRDFPLNRLLLVQKLTNILVLYKKEKFHFCSYFQKEGKVCK